MGQLNRYICKESITQTNMKTAASQGSEITKSPSRTFKYARNGLWDDQNGCYIMPPIPPIPPMPPIPPPGGIGGIAGLSSGFSATIASVVSSILATEAAFCSAV